MKAKFHILFRVFELNNVMGETFEAEDEQTAIRLFEEKYEHVKLMAMYALDEVTNLFKYHNLEPLISTIEDAKEAESISKLSPG